MKWLVVLRLRLLCEAHRCGVRDKPLEHGKCKLKFVKDMLIQTQNVSLAEKYNYLLFARALCIVSSKCCAVFETRVSRQRSR